MIRSGRKRSRGVEDESTGRNMSHVLVTVHYNQRGWKGCSAKGETHPNSDQSGAPGPPRRLSSVLEYWSGLKLRTGAHKQGSVPAPESG